METEKRPVTLKIAWVMLLIMGLLMTVGGLGSMYVAYRAAGEPLAGVSSQKLAELSPDLPTEIKARRATAAYYATSCGLFVIWISATAFRNRQKWAWYALLCSLGVGAVLSILRIPMLDHRAGAEPAAIMLVWLIVALAISFKDFK